MTFCLTVVLWIVNFEGIDSILNIFPKWIREEVMIIMNQNMSILLWWPSTENSINILFIVIPFSIFESIGIVFYLLVWCTIECLFYRDLWLVCAVLKYSVFMFQQCQLLKCHCQLQCTNIWRRKCFGKNSAIILRHSNMQFGFLVTYSLAWKEQASLS